MSHWSLPEQVQNPFWHVPVAPHWESTTQVPHVPLTHAWPPPHWLFAVHGAHAPATHASPTALLSGPLPDVVTQSR